MRPWWSCVDGRWHFQGRTNESGVTNYRWIHWYWVGNDCFCEFYDIPVESFWPPGQEVTL